MTYILKQLQALFVVQQQSRKRAMTTDRVQVVYNLFFEVEINLLAANVNDVKMLLGRHFAGRRGITISDGQVARDSNGLSGKGLLDSRHIGEDGKKTES